MALNDYDSRDHDHCCEIADMGDTVCGCDERAKEPAEVEWTDIAHEWWAA